MILRLGLCVALVLVPLLLLSSPGGVLSRQLSAHARVHRAVLRSSFERSRAVRKQRPRRHAASAARSATRPRLVPRPGPPRRPSVSVTPWTTRLALAGDIVKAAAASSTTVVPVPVVSAEYVLSSTGTSVPSTTTTTASPAPPTPPQPPRNEETGEASWYPAAAGTCASPNLPFWTEVTVTNLADNLSTTCVVDDRGPAVTGRIIDLSEQTFSQIADLSTGIIEVQITW